MWHLAWRRASTIGKTEDDPKEKKTVHTKPHLACNPLAKLSKSSASANFDSLAQLRQQGQHREGASGVFFVFVREAQHTRQCTYM